MKKPVCVQTTEEVAGPSARDIEHERIPIRIRILGGELTSTMLSEERLRVMQKVCSPVTTGPQGSPKTGQ
jgi:hypothetical protein